MHEHEHIRVGVRLIGVMLLALGIVGSFGLAGSILDVVLEDARWTNPVTEEDLAAIEALLRDSGAVSPTHVQGELDAVNASDSPIAVPTATALEVYRHYRLDIAPLLLLVVGWYFVFRGRRLVRAIHTSVFGPPTPVAPPST